MSAIFEVREGRSEQAEVVAAGAAEGEGVAGHPRVGADRRVVAMGLQAHLADLDRGLQVVAADARMAGRAVLLVEALALGQPGAVRGAEQLARPGRRLELVDQALDTGQVVHADARYIALQAGQRMADHVAVVALDHADVAGQVAEVEDLAVEVEDLDVGHESAGLQLVHLQRVPQCREAGRRVGRVRLQMAGAGVDCRAVE
ncbi:hypothetical protein IGA63_14840 [Pseudomonas aeruginosa]|nr:hypothetical protein [Pseudomonas aeruginosa]